MSSVTGLLSATKLLTTALCVVGFDDRSEGHAKLCGRNTEFQSMSVSAFTFTSFFVAVL